LKKFPLNSSSKKVLQRCARDNIHIYEFSSSKEATRHGVPLR